MGTCFGMKKPALLALRGFGGLGPLVCAYKRFCVEDCGGNVAFAAVMHSRYESPSYKLSQIPSDTRVLAFQREQWCSACDRDWALVLDLAPLSSGEH